MKVGGKCTDFKYNFKLGSSPRYTKTRNGQPQQTFITANHKADTSSNAKNDAREMGPFDCATAANLGFYANKTDFS